MLSFLRKKSSSPTADSVMTNANNSDTTLVTPAKAAKAKKPKQYEPYQAEFSGMGIGGMPSLGGMSFLEPPPVKANAKTNSKSSTEVKMVPGQPFKGQSKASFVEDRVSDLKGRESFETFSTVVVPTKTPSPERKLLKEHKAFFNNSFSNT